METLPRDLLFDLLLYLKNADLLNLCNSNKQLYNFCDESNERFWQQKVLFDYQNQPLPPKPANTSWKRFYIQLGKNLFKQIPVYYESELIGQIWISTEDKTQDLLHKSNNLFRTFYPDEDPDYLSNGTNALYWQQPLYEDQHDNRVLPKDIYDNTNRLIYFSKSYLNQVALSSFHGPSIPNPLQSININRTPLSRANFERLFDTFNSSANTQANTSVSGSLYISK